MTRPETAVRLARLTGALALATFAAAFAPGVANAAPRCTDLATDPANGIAGNPAIKSASSVIVLPLGGNVAYCHAQLL